MRKLIMLAAALVFMASGALAQSAASDGLAHPNADASSWMNTMGWRQLAFCSGAWIDLRGGGTNSWRPSRLAVRFLGCIEHNATGSQMAIAQSALDASNDWVGFSASQGKRQCYALWDVYQFAMERLDEDHQDAVEQRLTDNDYRVPAEADCK